MDGTNHKADVLIMNIGTSTEPLIKTIDERKPRYVIYVPSPTTREKIKEIEQGTEWKDVIDREIITLSNPDDLNTCMHEIHKGLVNFLDMKNLPREQLVIADYTGGTKSMSCAMALAMNDFNSKFNYVSGTKRDPANRGIVVSGHELILTLENPWSDMGIQPIRRLVYAFNNNQFKAAMNEAARLHRRKTGFERFFIGLESIIKAYLLWNNFDYENAESGFKNGIGTLAPYADAMPIFRNIYSNFKKDQLILKQVRADCLILKAPAYPLPSNVGYEFLKDLMGNVLRCAEHERYDDAVARLYSLTEKIAKLSLGKLGINNSNISLEVIEKLSPEFKNMYSIRPDTDGKYKIGLQASFALLGELNSEEPVYKVFAQIREDLDKTLINRNLSLLAHGYVPVREKDYLTLKNLVFQLLHAIGIKKEDIPAFSKLEMDGLLCEPATQTI